MISQAGARGDFAAAPYLRRRSGSRRGCECLSPALDGLRPDEDKFEAAAIRRRRMKFDVCRPDRRTARARPDRHRLLFAVHSAAVHAGPDRAPWQSGTDHFGARTAYESAVRRQRDLRRQPHSRPAERSRRSDRLRPEAPSCRGLGSSMSGSAAPIFRCRTARRSIRPPQQTERQREAAEFRAQGSERSQEIRARADRDVTVLLAHPTQGGEQARGDGDADRARIFAQAIICRPFNSL
jgi:hypothetical protein